MIKLTCAESSIQKNSDHYGKFIIEPLEIGQGLTVGNAFRRTLLGHLPNFGIAGARINNLKHEFSPVKGSREDALEILLNLKEVVFNCPSFISKETKVSSFSAFLSAKGPIVITAGMLQLPNIGISIRNPSKYICTLMDSSEFYLEVDAIYGKGYSFSEDFKNNAKKLNKFSKNRTLYLDTFFSPIIKVTYIVKLIYDANGNIKESLSLELVTNGSVTPKRVMQESAKILTSTFGSLLFVPKKNISF